MDPYQVSIRNFGRSLPERAGKIEDMGHFGVYWYRRPTGHTKTAARHHGETAWVTEWAYVLKDADGSWRIGFAQSGYSTRTDAIAAAPRV